MWFFEVTKLKCLIEFFFFFFIIRLKRALKKVYDQLTEEEVRRNVRGDDRLYVGPKHPAHKELADMYRMGMSYDNEVLLGIY